MFLCVIAWSCLYFCYVGFADMFSFIDSKQSVYLYVLCINRA